MYSPNGICVSFLIFLQFLYVLATAFFSDRLFSTQRQQWTTFLCWHYIVCDMHIATVLYTYIFTFATMQSELCAVFFSLLYQSILAIELGNCFELNETKTKNE